MRTGPEGNKYDFSSNNCSYVAGWLYACAVLYRAVSSSNVFTIMYSTSSRIRNDDDTMSREERTNNFCTPYIECCTELHYAKEFWSWSKKSL